MVTQHGLELAFQLITAHFGDLVAKVCKCFLHKGTLSLEELIRHTKLERAQLKNCLLVLIQHNCVQAFNVEIQSGAGAAPKTVTQYMALFDNILHRMRFPKFLVIVAERFDKQCETLLEGLLQHGRLSLDQIIDRAKQGNQGNSDAHQANFIKLVNAHFVERCPSSQPFVELNNESAQPRRRGSKAAEVIETVEQQAISAAAPSETERFSVIACVGNDITLGEEAKEQLPSIQVGEKSFSPVYAYAYLVVAKRCRPMSIVGLLEPLPKDRHIFLEPSISATRTKRKHEALEMDDETMTAIGKKEVLWRANFEEFVRCLRHKACVANVRSRMDVKTGTVLEAMLEATRSREKKVKEEESAPLLMDTILEEVRRRPEGLEMTLEHVRAALNQLGSYSSMGGTDGPYTVDLKSIIEVAQNDEVESVVLKRYGREAYRIFRLLAKNGRLVETDRISDVTFVEKKEANKILFKLWKDDYLHMEKLVLHMYGPPPFTLWKVNKETLWEHVLDEMYHAALNINQRIAYELEQEHEVLQLPRDVLDEAQEKRINRIRQVKALLEASLLRLDDALMLFHDF